MTQKNSFGFESVPLIFLLIFGIFWGPCDSQVSRGEANTPPDEHGGDDGPFFALRSCHQLLHGDAGEFFSPDYLCSNPPLWCNWTIQVDPGKRVHLHLEDLTPDDACHLKEDQVHVDEPAGPFGGHRLLQKCWREAKYTSSSNTLHVVLLIGGWPSPPYRGFYGRYQAFGPLVVYNPQEGFTERNRESEPVGLMDLNELGLNGERMERQHPSPVNPDLMYDYYDQAAAMTDELPWEPEEVGVNLHPASENSSRVYPLPTAPATTQGTLRSGRGAAQTASGPPDSSVHAESPQQQRDAQDLKLKPSTSPPTSTLTPTSTRRNVEEPSTEPGEAPAAPQGDGLSEETSDPLPSPSEGPEPEETEQTHPHPNMVEPLSDHRGNLNIRNHSELAHLPGDHLFEVTVEVSFSPDSEQSWDDVSRSLLLSVKALISERLKVLHMLLSMSPKRIKRLSTGVLYILWLQIGQGPGAPQVHRAARSALQGLVGADVGVRGNHGEAFITSMSTADVNECGTQLVLCDINADCENRFGSYSCRCRPGFQDESRLGSGGTVCVDVTAAGCSSGLTAETKGVYVLFFLLSSLVLMLLAAAGALYRRHHRGAFLVRCRSSGSVASPPDPDNNNCYHHRRDDGYPADSDLPPLPPPPPARGFREGWCQVKERCPAVDLPLLRFSPLLPPPDGYTEPQEGGKP